MNSTKPSRSRWWAIAIAAAAIALTSTACSAQPVVHGTDTPAAKSSNVDPAPSPHSSKDDSDGPNAALCADALGEGFAIDTNSSDLAKVLATWDQMSADSTGHIHDDIVTVDKALHKASSGDASAIGDAFGTSVTEVGTWVAENCNVQG